MGYYNELTDAELFINMSNAIYDGNNVRAQAIGLLLIARYLRTATTPIMTIEEYEPKEKK